MAATTTSKKSKLRSDSDAELFDDADASFTVSAEMRSAPKAPRTVYTPADLRRGKLLLLEFSRLAVGGKQSKKAEGDFDDVDELTVKSKKASRPRKSDAHTRIDTTTQKLVNLAYAKMLNHFPPTPFGIFVENSEVEAKAHAVLAKLRKIADHINDFAILWNSPRRVRLDMYAVPWNPTDMPCRIRMSEMIAEKLIELRESYTSKIMWVYRVQMAKIKHVSRLLVGEQAEVVEEAIAATKRQREYMIAIYGERCPDEFYDSRGQLREEIRLDFGPIDRAIRTFCPSWQPPEGRLPSHPKV